MVSQWRFAVKILPIAVFLALLPVLLPMSAHSEGSPADVPESNPDTVTIDKDALSGCDPTLEFVCIPVIIQRSMHESTQFAIGNYPLAGPIEGNRFTEGELRFDPAAIPDLLGSSGKLPGTSAPQ